MIFFFKEAVQRLFNTNKPNDELTQWSANFLKDLKVSVDGQLFSLFQVGRKNQVFHDRSPVAVPTFVAFLVDVESPYEVSDYVRDYLGESKHSNEFARQFVAKRISLRSENNNKHQEVGVQLQYNVIKIIQAPILRNGE